MGSIVPFGTAATPATPAAPATPVTPVTDKTQARQELEQNLGLDGPPAQPEGGDDGIYKTTRGPPFRLVVLVDSVLVSSHQKEHPLQRSKLCGRVRGSPTWMLRDLAATWGQPLDKQMDNSRHSGRSHGGFGRAR